MNRHARSRSLATLVAVIAALMAAASAQAAMREITRAQYGASLGVLSHALSADRKTGGSKALLALTPILHCAVRLDSRLIYVDNTGLEMAVEYAEHPVADRDKRISAVIVKVDAIRDDMATPLDRTRVSKGVAAARSVLQSDVYASDPIPPPGKAEEIGQKIQKWWDDFWRKFKGPTVPTPHINPKIPLAILIVIVVLAVALLIRYLFGYYMSRTRSRVAARPETMLALDEEEAELVAARNFDRLMDLAGVHASDSDFRGAFRLVYVALLVALDTDGIVRLNRSKTNWEYLRALRGGRFDALYPLMRPITTDFDRIWYGFAQPSQSDYDIAVAQYQEIRRVASSIALAGQTAAA